MLKSNEPSGRSDGEWTCQQCWPAFAERFHQEVCPLIGPAPSVTEQCLDTESKHRQAGIPPHQRCIAVQPSELDWHLVAPQSSGRRRDSRDMTRLTELRHDSNEGLARTPSHIGWAVCGPSQLGLPRFLTVKQGKAKRQRFPRSDGVWRLDRADQRLRENPRGQIALQRLKFRVPAGHHVMGATWTLARDAGSALGHHPCAKRICRRCR
jgi:hypothetical protein